MRSAFAVAVAPGVGLRLYLAQSPDIYLVQALDPGSAILMRAVAVPDPGSPILMRAVAVLGRNREADIC